MLFSFSYQDSTYETHQQETNRVGDRRRQQAYKGTFSFSYFFCLCCILMILIFPFLTQVARKPLESPLKIQKPADIPVIIESDEDDLSPVLNLTSRKRKPQPKATDASDHLQSNFLGKGLLHLLSKSLLLRRWRR